MLPPPLPHRLQTPARQFEMDQQRSPWLQDFTNFIPSPAAPSPSPSAAAAHAPSPSAAAFKAPEPEPKPKPKVEPVSPSPHLLNDPIFFTDPSIKRDIAAFFGVATTTPPIFGNDTRTQHPFNFDASYNHPAAFTARYNPAANDLHTFMDWARREEKEAAEEEKWKMAERKKVMLEEGKGEVDALSEPLLTKAWKSVKGRKGGNKRGRGEVGQ